MFGERTATSEATEEASGAVRAEAVADASPRHGLALWPSLAGCILALTLAAVVAVSRGPVDIPLATVWRALCNHLLGMHTGGVSASADAIVWQIRLPRVVLAGLAGAALACSGATYQGIFRNPLADPYLIGVAAGASLGAAVAIVTPLHSYWHGLSPLPVFAFAGAAGAVALSYGIARSGGVALATTLILAGVAVSTLASAAMSFLFLSHSDKALTIVAWLLGGFNTSTWRACLIVVPYIASGVSVMLLFGRALNVLQVGEEQAQLLGLPVERMKLALLAAASLAAAAAVAVSGLIGFVGLIVPHAVRLVWGPDYRRLLPLATVLGAAFLILADIVARLALAPEELPIGVVTAFCGVPIFLLLLRRRAVR
jgi:iron complex transport system permease protein